VDVGYPVAQLGGQLSGGEFGGVAVSTRPTADAALTDLTSAKLPLNVPLH
jgi:hypothetical protein